MNALVASPLLLVLLLASSSLRDEPLRPGPAGGAGASPVLAEVSEADRNQTLPGPIPARILQVIDGDSVEVSATIWLGQQVTTIVRLRGIDAPELQSPCAEEARLAAASRDALLAHLGSGSVALTMIGRDKYGGRVLARLRLASGQDVGAAMLASGHARPYAGGRRSPWGACALTARR